MAVGRAAHLAFGVTLKIRGRPLYGFLLFRPHLESFGSSRVERGAGPDLLDRRPDLVECCFEPLAAGTFDARGDQRVVYVVIAELAAVFTAGEFVEQDLHAVQLRVGRAELLLDARARLFQRCLANFDQAAPAGQRLPDTALPIRIILADNGVGVDAVGHSSSSSRTAPGRYFAPPGRWLAGIGESSDRLTLRGLMVLSM